MSEVHRPGTKTKTKTNTLLGFWWSFRILSGPFLHSRVCLNPVFTLSLNSRYPVWTLSICLTSIWTLMACLSAGILNYISTLYQSFLKPVWTLLSVFFLYCLCLGPVWNLPGHSLNSIWTHGCYAEYFLTHPWLFLDFLNSVVLSGNYVESVCSIYVPLYDAVVCLILLRLCL